MSTLSSHRSADAWTWGCDVRAGVAAFGALHTDGRCKTWSASIGEQSPLRGAQRLHCYRNQLDDRCARRIWPPPTVIVIEIPQMRGASQVVLMTHVGVTMEWLQANFPCPQLELKSAEWKQTAGIGGGADKAAIMRRAVELGLGTQARPTLQDEADALVMALAARNLLER